MTKNLRFARHACAEARNDRRVLASTLPDFGSPALSGVFSIWGSVLLTTYALLRGKSTAKIQWVAFVGAYYGATAGCFVYVLGLITGLY